MISTLFKRWLRVPAGLTNEPSRIAWLEKTLRNIPDGLTILDAGAGEGGRSEDEGVVRAEGIGAGRAEVEQEAAGEADAADGVAEEVVGERFDPARVWSVSQIDAKEAGVDAADAGGHDVIRRRRWPRAGRWFPPAAGATGRA